MAAARRSKMTKKARRQARKTRKMRGGAVTKTQLTGVGEAIKTSSAVAQTVSSARASSAKAQTASSARASAARLTR